MPQLICSIRRLFLVTCCLLGISLLLWSGGTDTALAHDGAHVTVRTGDTLSQIAKNHGVGTAELLQLNNLSSANHIRVGQVIAIPGYASGGLRSSATSSPAVPQGWQTYIVKPGDSLSVLARDYRVGLARLAEINLISPSQNLYVGQSLKLPAGAASSPSSESTSSSAEHIVQRGEQLGRIAKRYGVTMSAIAWANNLNNTNHIYVGQRLTIPSGNQAAAVQDASYFPTTTEKWIDVNLSTQTVTAYNGTEAVQSFLVSTGLPATPTVQGTFRIWGTTPIQDMFRLSRSGASDSTSNEYDYYLKDVEWVQYFHKDYAFHAAYWHNNFGQPMSHGCVNMRPGDAEWLFNWASPQASKYGWSNLSGYNRGTLVKVHY